MVWYLRFLGHDVTWTVGETHYAECLAGLIPPPVDNIPDPETYDLVVFDGTGNGKAADDINEVTPVIGDSTFCDELEHDRVYGIEMMEKAGIKVPVWEKFNDIGAAKAWLKKTHKRCVFKPSGEADSASTYVSKSAEDMIAYLELLTKRAHVKEFVLQEFVVGTEISTEGWFNGTEFVLFDHTLEEKKFMSGNLGPNTGCSGNVVWVPKRINPIIEQGLAKFAPILRDAGFRGPIDLNTIVTEDSVYGIEWTPRFGYEGTCNLTRCVGADFGEFMFAVATGQAQIQVLPNHEFVASIRLSVPPYPNEIKSGKNFTGVPIEGLDVEKLDTFYVCNVKQGDDGLETVIPDQMIGCPMGKSESLTQAFEDVKAAIKQLRIPDLQYRNDVPESIKKRYDTLMQQGWLRNIG